MAPSFRLPSWHDIAAMLSECGQHLLHMTPRTLLGGYPLGDFALPSITSSPRLSAPTQEADELGAGAMQGSPTSSTILPAEEPSQLDGHIDPPRPSDDEPVARRSKRQQTKRFFRNIWPLVAAVLLLTVTSPVLDRHVHLLGAKDGIPRDDHAARKDAGLSLAFWLWFLLHGLLLSGLAVARKIWPEYFQARNPAVRAASVDGQVPRGRWQRLVHSVRRFRNRHCKHLHWRSVLASLGTLKGLLAAQALLLFFWALRWSRLAVHQPLEVSYSPLMSGPVDVEDFEAAHGFVEGITPVSKWLDILFFTTLAVVLLSLLPLLTSLSIQGSKKAARHYKRKRQERLALAADEEDNEPGIRLTEYDDNNAPRVGGRDGHNDGMIIVPEEELDIRPVD